MYVWVAATLGRLVAVVSARRQQQTSGTGQRGERATTRKKVCATFYSGTYSGLPESTQLPKVIRIASETIVTLRRQYRQAHSD